MAGINTKIFDVIDDEVYEAAAKDEGINEALANLPSGVGISRQVRAIKEAHIRRTNVLISFARHIGSTATKEMQTQAIAN